jgi:hypothetical protein
LAGVLEDRGKGLDIAAGTFFTYNTLVLIISIKISMAEENVAKHIYIHNSFVVEVNDKAHQFTSPNPISSKASCMF